MLAEKGSQRQTQLFELIQELMEGRGNLTGLIAWVETLPKNALNVPNEVGERPLHWAVTLREGQTLVAEMIARGAELHARTESGETLLHYAVKAYRNHELVQFLVTSYPEVRQQMECRDLDLHTPLDAAIKTARLETVNYLLAEGAHSNHADHEGNTPLHLAAQRFSFSPGFAEIEILKTLLTHTREVHAKNQKEESARDLAFPEGRPPEAGPVQALFDQWVAAEQGTIPALQVQVSAQEQTPGIVISAPFNFRPGLPGLFAAELEEEYQRRLKSLLNMLKAAVANEKSLIQSYQALKRLKTLNEPIHGFYKRYEAVYQQGLAGNFEYWLHYKDPAVFKQDESFAIKKLAEYQPRLEALRQQILPIQGPQSSLARWIAHLQGQGRLNRQERERLCKLIRPRLGKNLESLEACERQLREWEQQASQLREDAERIKTCLDFYNEIAKRAGLILNVRALFTLSAHQDQCWDLFYRGMSEASRDLIAAMQAEIASIEDRLSAYPEVQLPRPNLQGLGILGQLSGLFGYLQQVTTQLEQAREELIWREPEASVPKAAFESRKEAAARADSKGKAPEGREDSKIPPIKLSQQGQVITVRLEAPEMSFKAQKQSLAALETKILEELGEEALAEITFKNVAGQCVLSLKAESEAMGRTMVAVLGIPVSAEEDAKDQDLSAANEGQYQEVLQHIAHFKEEINAYLEIAPPEQIDYAQQVLDYLSVCQDETRFPRAALLEELPRYLEQERLYFRELQEIAMARRTSGPSHLTALSFGTVGTPHLDAGDHYEAPPDIHPRPS